MEGRTSELKADDKMTDELSPDGLHIFTPQSHSTAAILHIFTQSFSYFHNPPLPVIQLVPPVSHSLTSQPSAPLSLEVDQFRFAAKAFGRRKKCCKSLLSVDWPPYVQFMLVN